MGTGKDETVLMRICMVRTLAAACGALMLVAAAAVTGPAIAAEGDAEFLESLVGQWTGSGTLRQSGEAAPEPVSCRLDVTWEEQGRTVRHAMKCLGIDLQFTAQGSLTLLDNPGTFTGTWKASVGPDTAHARGTRDPETDTLDLLLVSRRPQTGEEEQSAVAIRLLEGATAMSNTFRARDRATHEVFDVLDLRFERSGQAAE